MRLEIQMRMENGQSEQHLKRVAYKERAAAAKVFPERRHWQKTGIDWPARGPGPGSCPHHCFTSLSSPQTLYSFFV